MTLPATTVPRAARAEGTAVATAAREGAGHARRHVGCYWDVEQAAWVPHGPVPLPRPALD